MSRREYHQRYYAENVERINAARKARYRRSPTADLTANRRWRAANPDRQRYLIRAWRSRNREAVCAAEARRRKRRAASDVRHTPQEWAARVYEYGGACAYCLRSDVRLTRDHLRPLVQGGTDSIDNIVPACLSCNAGKGGRTLVEMLLTQLRSFDTVSSGRENLA